MENITTEEKIDYIFKTIKKQEKRLLIKGIFKWIFRLFILGYLIYFYLFGFEILLNSIKNNLNINIDTQEIINGLKQKININK